MSGDGFQGRMQIFHRGVDVDGRTAARVPDLPRGNAFIARFRVRAIRKLYEEFNRLVQEEAALQRSLGDRALAALFRERAEMMLANSDEIHAMDADIRAAKRMEAAMKREDAALAAEIRKMDREWELKVAKEKHEARMQGKAYAPGERTSSASRAGREDQASKETIADMMQDINDLIPKLLKNRNEADLTSFEKDMLQELRSLRGQYA